MVPPEGEAMAAARALTVRDELAPPVTRAVTSVPMLVVGSSIDRSEPDSVKQKASPIACSGIAASVPARPRMRCANLKSATQRSHVGKLDQLSPDQRQI